MTRPPDRHPWYLTPDGWRHAPRWKRVANTVLRALQPQRYRWVFYTVTDDTPDGRELPPVVRGYGFGRVDCRRGRW